MNYESKEKSLKAIEAKLKENEAFRKGYLSSFASGNEQKKIKETQEKKMKVPDVNIEAMLKSLGIKEENIEKLKEA